MLVIFFILSNFKVLSSSIFIMNFSKYLICTRKDILTNAKSQKKKMFDLQKNLSKTVEVFKASYSIKLSV